MTGAELQFDRAEPVAAEAAPEVRCTACNDALSSYFEVNGAVACERCKVKLDAMRSASHVPTLFRAAVLGFLAAVAGAILYYAVAAITGYELGLISIVVGLMVGFAVRKGARGRGGWRYQALAMFLCYAAIASTYVPRVIEAFREQERKGAAEAQGSPAAAPVAPVDAPPAAAASGTPTAGAAGEVSTGEAAMAVLFLLGLMLALPFLAGVENIMGVVIIAIALYEAWKVNRAAPFSVSGPFAVGAARDG